MDQKHVKSQTAAVRDFGGCPSALDGRNILVTGATGSFGRAFIQTLLADSSPRRLVVFSRDEMKQYEMEADLQRSGLNTGPVRFFLGDVRDQSRLELAMNGIDLVIHAAALKHVPAAEYNPFECIHTNVIGAENVVRASLRAGVRDVLALSTDKASAPINLYGASKLASDKIFIAANNLSGAQGCRFSVVRYGNVMGSRGSVVPFFRRLLAEGADRLPITDKRMTRFWITIQQGVSFVISCASSMIGGELFVPKIPSIRVIDLAEAIAPDLKHEVVGIRPGEKLHESMITEGDARTTIELADRYVMVPAFRFSSEARQSHYDGKSVDESFRYSSEHNTEWLDVGQLRTLLHQL
jgi:UDP-N-acetylglucosamine 4,6-dehydratase